MYLIHVNIIVITLFWHSFPERVKIYDKIRTLINIWICDV